jgi:hypothetical protein
VDVTLIRVVDTGTATAGVLLIDGNPKYVTIEPPWKDNQHNISCIPVGIYQAKRVESEKFGQCFRLENVPGRDLIEIHCGNSVEDTEGCILLGTQYSPVSNFPYIMYSTVAYDSFIRNTIGHDEVMITIKGPA